MSLPLLQLAAKITKSLLHYDTERTNGARAEEGSSHRRGEDTAVEDAPGTDEAEPGPGQRRRGDGAGRHARADLTSREGRTGDPGAGAASGPREERVGERRRQGGNAGRGGVRQIGRAHV